MEMLNEKVGKIIDKETQNKAKGKYDNFWDFKYSTASKYVDHFDSLLIFNNLSLSNIALFIK